MQTRRYGPLRLDFHEEDCFYYLMLSVLHCKIRVSLFFERFMKVTCVIDFRAYDYGIYAYMLNTICLFLPQFLPLNAS